LWFGVCESFESNKWIFWNSEEDFVSGDVGFAKEKKWIFEAEK
jgi:hypothetical protein